MEAASNSWRSLGDILVDRGLLSREQLELALAEETATRRRLADILVQRGLASGHDITSALVEQMKHFEANGSAETRPTLTVVAGQDEDMTRDRAPNAESELRPVSGREAEAEQEPDADAAPAPPGGSPSVDPVEPASTALLPVPSLEDDEIRLSRPPEELIGETTERRLTAESRLEMLDGIGDGLERIRAELEAQELATPPLVRELEATRERVVARKQALTEEIDELERTRVALEQTSVELDRLRAELAVKLHDLSELKATAALWTTRVDDLESEVDALVANIDGLARQLAQLVERGARAPGLQAVTEVHPRVEEDPHPDPTPTRSTDQTYLLFLPHDEGYDLVERDGPAPAVGDSIEVGGAAWVVTKVGPSPLPYDERTCVFFSAG